MCILHVFRYMYIYIYILLSKEGYRRLQAFWILDRCCSFASAEVFNIYLIFFFQMFWKDSLSKKIALEYDLSCINRKIWYFFFPNIWSYSLDKIWKMIFLRIIHENMIFSASALTKWSFQKTCTGIWSFFNYQERWCFCFLEIWSHSLSPYFELICSNLLISLQITFPPNQICTGMCSSECWWFYKDTHH